MAGLTPPPPEDAGDAGTDPRDVLFRDDPDTFLAAIATWKPYRPVDEQRTEEEE